jgi:UMF1 family MFS transporter
LLLLSERAVTCAPGRIAGLSGVDGACCTTWREARRFRDFAWLLATGPYQAGIMVVIALAAVYAEAGARFQAEPRP